MNKVNVMYNQLIGYKTYILIEKRIWCNGNWLENMRDKYFVLLLKNKEHNLFKSIRSFCRVYIFQLFDEY